MAPSIWTVTGADWAVVGRLFQMYVHDLSRLRGTLPDATGSFVFKQDRFTPYVQDTSGEHAAFQEENDAAARFWRDVADTASPTTGTRSCGRCRASRRSLRTCG